MQPGGKALHTIHPSVRIQYIPYFAQAEAMDRSFDSVLSLWRNDNEGILIMGATNTPWHLDAAFRRPGRFDRILFIPPPDDSARESIFKLKLNGKPIDAIDYAGLAQKTQSYSGADIEAVIDITIEEKLEAAFTDGVPHPIATKDLLNACKKHKASTLEWFSTAKNFALYANDSGLYDDILTYMKIKK